MSHLPPAASYRRVPLLPCDAPALITDLNPACLCGHAQHVHEPDLSWDGGAVYSRCTIEECPCRRFRDECFGDDGED